MYNADTDLLFPPRVIPTLRELRGKAWRDLVDRVLALEPTDVERMAFVLLMIRLGNCVSCHADSFRALRGCTLCASQTVRRFRGSDEDLLGQYEQCKKEVETYLQRK